MTIEKVQNEVSGKDALIEKLQNINEAKLIAFMK